MSDTLYKKLYSYKNLNLAWTRIKTAQNIPYKNYYRSLFLGYELSKIKNLEKLSERLQGRSYIPSQIVRFYIPKSTGLHRPLSFLYLDDLIVYQAIANIIADKFAKDRQLVENKNVFSNIINRDKDRELFFFRKWQEGYRQFLAKIRAFYIGGAHWVGHFDIAAYYDTISHTALLQQISKKAYQKFKELLERCLNEWSSSKPQKVGHGIPQGPIASDLLGEIYLLPIDTVLKKHKIQYVRYVDDIKIFGKSRKEVLSGVLVLERECKERGLIPHAKKYEIIKAKTIDEAIGKFPSLTINDKKAIPIDKKETAKLFVNAFQSDSFDISKVKYILKASPPNGDIVRVVLDNLDNHPELVEEFCIFLENHKTSASIGNLIYKNALINKSHFDFVEGKFWELLSTYHFDGAEKKRMIDRAIKRLVETKDSPPLKYGLYRFIASTGNALILKWLDREKSPFIQMLIIGHIGRLNLSKPEFLTFANKMIRRGNYEPGLVCIKQLYSAFEFDVIKKLDKPLKDFSGVLQNTLGIPDRIDSIGEILARRYAIPYSKKWSSLLGSEYEHANTLIFLADHAFFIDRNAWMGYTDSFADLVIRKFIELLTNKVPLSSGKAYPKIVNEKGENVDYGILLDSKNQLSINYPQIVDGLRKFHNRRSKAPTAHAFDKKTGAKTTIVTDKEQKVLVKELKSSLSNLVNVI